MEKSLDRLYRIASSAPWKLNFLSQLRCEKELCVLLYVLRYVYTCYIFFFLYFIHRTVYNGYVGWVINIPQTHEVLLINPHVFICNYRMNLIWMNFGWSAHLPYVFLNCDFIPYHMFDFSQCNRWSEHRAGVISWESIN